jgi:hypothetical protein
MKKSTKNNYKKAFLNLRKAIKDNAEYINLKDKFGGNVPCSYVKIQYLSEEMELLENNNQ